MYRSFFISLIIMMLATGAFSYERPQNQPNQQQSQIGINKSKNNNQSSAQQSQNVSTKIYTRSDIREANRVPVSTAYAPLVIPTSDCLAAVSAGGQGQFLGLSFGGTVQSRPCNIREYAKMFIALGETDTAINILRQDDLVNDVFIGNSISDRVIADKDICRYPNVDCRRYMKFN